MPTLIDDTKEFEVSNTQYKDLRKQVENGNRDRVITAVEDDTQKIRRLAVEILARYPYPEVVPPLAKAMQDPDSEVAAAAKRTIDHLESLVKGGAIN